MVAKPQEQLWDHKMDRANHIHYKAVFDTPPGRLVLEDLRRIIRRTPVDPRDPKTNTCVFKEAQQQLIDLIERMIDYKETDNEH